MSSLNQAHLIGHLGKDPKVANLPRGGKVTTFSLATSERWKDWATGEKRERTEWHNIVIFNEARDPIAERVLKKGARCFIEGQIRTREYTDQTGVDRYTTEIVLSPDDGKIVLLEHAPHEESADGTTRSPTSATPCAAPCASPRRAIWSCITAVMRRLTPPRF